MNLLHHDAMIQTGTAQGSDSMSSRPRIALLCSGLGNIRRGHEVFARDLFDLLKAHLDITLFKGGGAVCDGERVLPHIPRNAASLDHIHAHASPKWQAAAIEQERLRVEAETFAYAALQPLLDGGFDIIHCLEREVCSVLYDNRHLFAKTPRFLWSNGGALAPAEQPPCDFVQEHSAHNLSRSRRDKAFMIPHGVDMQRFHPSVQSHYRVRHGIPADAFVAISVGSICYWHKRMDYVIREVAAVPGAWLVIVGQSTADTPAIRQLGQQLMGNRIVFDSMPHDELPQAYAAADVFVLGSLFETFGIVYIEAMAMGLPVICTDHPNQRAIVQQGLFVDMRRAGELARALRDTPREQLRELGQSGLRVVEQSYDLAVLRQQYLEQYARMASESVTLARVGIGRRLRSHAASLTRSLRGLA